jgi:peptidoglycan/LPS O-acetylase OafA/YrhL
MRSGGGPATDAAVPVRLGRLDVVRGLSALYVAIYHAIRNLTESGLQFSEKGAGARLVADGNMLGVFAYGHYAVLMFFVLSGYSIHLRLARSHAEASPFGTWFQTYTVRRATRIVPPLIAGITLTIAVSALGHWLFPDDFAAAITGGKGAAPDLHQALGVLILRDLDGPVGANNTFWSVQAEILMYCAYVPIAFLIGRYRVSMFAFLALSLALAAALYIDLQIRDVSRFSPLASIAVFYLPVWIAGAALAELQLRHQTLLRRVSVPLLSLGGVGVVALSLLSDNTIKPPIDLAWTVSLLLLFAVIVARPVDERPTLRLLRTLANCSYTLYLTHMPLQFLVLAVSSDSARPTGPLVAVAALVANVGCAVLVSRIVEVPSQRFGSRLCRQMANERATHRSDSTAQ